MKIEALTERYQTRRKTALNRVLVEPEKFATRRREHIWKMWSPGNGRVGTAFALTGNDTDSGTWQAH
jgi:hypothetical protein